VAIGALLNNSNIKKKAGAKTSVGKSNRMN